MNDFDFFNRDTADDSHSFTSEDKIVKAILKQAGESTAYKAIQAECRSQTGLDKITLSWFVNRYMSFPVWLGTRKVEWQRDVFGTLLKKFTLTPCYKAWEEIDTSKPDEDDRPAGCVFTWPQFGVCVIHQYASSALSAGDGMWITRKMASFEERFVIEPLGQLLSFIDWKLPR
jgi:hypothetical protein